MHDLTLNGTIAIGDFQKEINLSLKSDQTLIVQGQNGSGKTTLLKSIIGLLPLIEGELSFENKILDGCDTKTFIRPDSRDMAIVFSEPRLFGFMNLLKNVTFGLQLQNPKPSKAEMTNQAKDLLTQLGLENFLNYSPKNISKGQAQKVSLARALIVKSKLLLLDEPFTAIDADSIELISELIKKSSAMKILVTHDQAQAEKILEAEKSLTTLKLDY